MAQEIDKAFIRKFIAGNCDSEERERMREFLRQPEADQLFDEVLNEDWQGYIKEAPSSDTYIESFRQRMIKKQSALPGDTFRPAFNRLKIYRYAAVWATFLILGAAGYSFWRSGKQLPQSQAVAMLSAYNPKGQRSKVTLADGSIVTLGAGSKLDYPAQFEGATREISLQGEAFFQVTKDPDKPFIVHTGNIRTRVLGTSFKVEAFDSGPVTIAVATGKVQVGQKIDSTNALRPLATLLPGKMIEWNPMSGQATLGDIAPEDITTWEKGKLSFVGVPFSKMVKTLERWYDVKIVIRNKQIGAYKMNIILDGNLPLTSSLEILKVTVKADYRVTGHAIIIE